MTSVRLKVRGRELTLDHAAMARDVRVSRVKPFRDEARLSEPGYVHSLPPAPAGRAYVARDANGALQMFLGHKGAEGDDDPEAEEIVPPLPAGNYHSVSSYDGVHIYRDEGEEQLPPVANNGSPPIGNLPNALTELNAKTQDFWRRQLAGEAPNAAPPNVAAIASVMRDPGTRDSAMHMQAALKQMNLANRQHYASGGQDRTHDAGPAKGPPTAAQINAKNRARWGAGRQ